MMLLKDQQLKKHLKGLKWLNFDEESKVNNTNKTNSNK